jgi:O-antigen ligase
VERVRSGGWYPELIPGLLAVGAFVVWAVAAGGFMPTAWYPGAVFLLGLLVATAIGYRGERLPRLNAVALACLAAFTLWSFVSIAWAGSQGDAWDGANRTLLYLTVFAIFSLPGWRAPSAGIVLGAYSVAIALVGAGSLIDAAESDEAVLSFISGRFSEPMGYHNANTALFLGAFWPALFLASRAEVPWAARPILLAAAGLLAELALLGQSRGSAVAFPIALLVYFVVVPNRVRSLIAIVPVVGTVAVTAPPILDVYEAWRGDGVFDDAVDTAVRAMAISFIALLGAGAVLALVDRWLRVPERAARVAERAVGAAAAAGVIAALILAIGAIGNPWSWAEDRWDDFKGGYAEAGFESTRFSGSLGSNRYDFWRVSLDEFSDSPLTGMGADNFAAEYLRDRQSPEEPEHPHSLPVKVVSQTGLVGAALFVGFLAFAVASAVRVRRFAGSWRARAVAGAAIATFAYWFIHGAGDWFWVYPALSAPAIAWLALAGRVDAGGGPGPPRESAGIGVPFGRVAVVVGAVVALAAAASYVLPWGAARETERATSIWATDPRSAFERLDRARDLNFLSERPDLLAGAIASRHGDRRRMRDSFTNALERNPESWYARFELGALDAVEGRRSAAISRLEAARGLNPSEPLIGTVLRGARSGDPVPLRRIDREFLARVCERVGRTKETRYCGQIE